MTPRDALLAALHLAPDDNTAWLALADCLEEEGDTGPAELLRLHRQVRAMRTSPKRRQLEERAHELLASGVRPVVPTITNSVKMRLALIPPGKFRMGSPVAEPRRMDDEPLHTVRITRAFYLGVYPVTQDEYRAVTRRAPSHFNRRRVKEPGVDVGRFPVESLSWEDAVAFCQVLSARPAEQEAGRTYRLPTEAEWEYACRAWGSTHFPFHGGETLSAGQANFDCHFPYPPTAGGPVVPPVPYLGRTCAVGRYAPNAFGLYDLHGNVDEWCQDWYDADYYYHGPEADPPGPEDEELRIIRGGSWRGQGEDCRAAVRIGYDPDETFWHVGFRVACDVRR